MSHKYVHGYSKRENVRLFDQANTLAELLHHDTIYPTGCSVLEAGCGVGAQTVILARNNPRVHFTSIDRSASSLQAAESLIQRAGLTNVTFQLADIFSLPFTPESFDHLFVCFVLEHLPDPVSALVQLKSVLKRDGTITVIEGDHGSTYFHPDSQAARQTIQCLVKLQAEIGGNALVGRQLYPLLSQAGFRQPMVSPRMVYVDSSRPAWVEGFTRNTFIAMVEGVREAALAAGLIEAPHWDQGITDLYATTAANGVFCYTFFKGVARK